MEDALISVIIPVYNVEPYLERCVNSVLNQDYSNLEVFLVDDGSKDNSGKICDDFALKDNRIKVLHQANAGQSAARNAALKLSKGKYVAFIDSDDYWDVDCLSFLLNLLVKYEAQLAICAVRHIGFPGQKDNEIVNDNIYVCEGADIPYNILAGKNGFSASASHMLIDADLCRNNFFLEGVIYEDLEYMVRLSFLEKRAVTSKMRKYNYCYRPDNSSSTPTAKRKHDIDVVIKNLRSLIEEKAPELIPCVNNRYISNNIHHLQSLHKGEEYLFDEIRDSILQYDVEKTLLPKSNYFLYNALKHGKLCFKISNFVYYNIYRKLKCFIKGFLKGSSKK